MLEIGAALSRLKSRMSNVTATRRLAICKEDCEADSGRLIASASGRTWRLCASVSIGFLPRTTDCRETSPTSDQIAGSMG
jgi:hypothetical protein